MPTEQKRALMRDPDAPRDTADYGPMRDPDHMLGPDETYCLNCGVLALEHTGGRYSIYGVCPDPRGDAACPECDEGEMIPGAFSRWGVASAECNACGRKA